MVEFFNSHSSPYRGQHDVNSQIIPLIASPSSSLPSSSSSLSQSSQSQLTIISGVSWRLPFVYFDIVSSLLALVGNLLIVAAVVRTKFALAGYRRFLLSLAIADIFMASTTILTFCHEKMAGRYKWQLIETCGNNFLRSLTLVGYFASLLSIGGLTADNFLGIFKPLSYNALMGGKRLVRAIAGLWVISLLLGFIDLPITVGIFLYHQSNKKPAASLIKATPPNSANNNNLFFQFNTRSWENNNDDDLTTTTVIPNLLPLQPSSSSSSVSNDQKNLPVMMTPRHLPFSATVISNNTNNNIIDERAVFTMMTTDNVPGDDLPLDLHGLIHDVLELIEEEQESTDWCTYYASNKFGVEFFVIGLTVPCFLLLLLIYGRIFLEVIRRRSSRQRKTFRLVLTTLLLIFSFTFCWMPFIIFELFMYLRTSSSSPPSNEASASSSSSSAATDNKNGVETATMKPSSYTSSSSNQALLVNTIFNSLLMLSPLLNPIIYSTRLRRVRMQVLAILTCYSRKWVDKFTHKNKHGDEANHNTHHLYLNGNGHHRPSSHNPLSPMPSRLTNTSTNNDGTSSSRSTCLRHHSSLRMTRSTNSSSFWGGASSTAVSPPETPYSNNFLSPSPSYLFPPNHSSNALTVVNSIGNANNGAVKMSPSASFSNGSAVFNGSAAIANMKPDFRCHVRGCDALFLSQAAFFRHITSKHGDYVNVCDRCFEIYYREYGHVCSSSPPEEENAVITLQSPTKSPKQPTLPVTPLIKEPENETSVFITDNENRQDVPANKTRTTLSSDSSSNSNRSSLTLPTSSSLRSRSRSFLIEDRKVSENELRSLRVGGSRASNVRRLSCGAVERRKRNQAKKERKRRRRLTVTGVVLTSLAEEDDDDDTTNEDFINNEDDDETSYESVCAALTSKNSFNSRNIERQTVITSKKS